METENFKEIYDKALDIRKGISRNINDFKYRKCQYCGRKTWRWTVLWQLAVGGRYSDWLWILKEQQPDWPSNMALCINKQCSERIQVKEDHFSTYGKWIANEFEIKKYLS